MILDILLPLVLFLIAVTVVFLFTVYEKKASSLFGGVRLRIRHVILLVAVIAMMVTVLVFVPESSMQVLFLFAYSAILFFFAYLVTPKWYFAVPLPILFIALYLSPYWNIYLFNFFAITFAVCVSVYMGSLFDWKTTVVFVALVTAVDIVQVLITGFTLASAEKALGLRLPVGIVLPTFPYEGRTFLGLGDVFLLGLLSIQTTQKYGRKFGLASIVSMTIVFSLLYTILLNFDVKSFPATVLVLSGWLTALVARYLGMSHFRRG